AALSGRDAGRVAARLGADAARGLRRRARHVSEGPDEGAGELARPHQRRIYLSEETHFRRGDRAPLEGDPARQRQEGDSLRPFLSRARLPAARDVRGCPDLLPENPQARTEPDRGVLRAGARLLVRRRSGPGETNVGRRLQGEQVQSLGQEVSGHPGPGASGAGAAAHLGLVWLLLQSGPPVGVTVGRVTAVAWPSQQALAVGLAQAAEGAAPFPGVGPLPERPIRLILAPTRATFDSLTGGRLPGWSEGAAFPDRSTVVLLSERPSVRLSAALRHELAHLALRARVRRALPLWFEEGYAAVAAGEWDRLDALRLNWQVARGVELDLDELDRTLRSDQPDATTAYALATTAVLLLERWGGGRGLEPLIEQLTPDPT